MSTKVPMPDSTEEQPKHRKIPYGAIAATVAIVVAVCAAVPFTPLMSVNDIAVEGSVNLPEEEVRNLTGIDYGTPIGKVKPRRAAENVAANPWVDSATVSRAWPNGVSVEITEHDPVAWVDIDGQPHLIDREGRDFIVAAPPAGAVEIQGVAQERFAQAVEVASSISDVARPRVRALKANGDYTYTLVLDDDRVVQWGAATDNANKALALETVLQLEGHEFNISNPELVTLR